MCVSYSFIAKQETTSLLFHNVVPSWSQGHESSESTWSLFFCLDHLWLGTFHDLLVSLFSLNRECGCKNDQKQIAT